MGERRSRLTALVPPGAFEVFGRAAEGYPAEGLISGYNVVRVRLPAASGRETVACGEKGPVEKDNAGEPVRGKLSGVDSRADTSSSGKKGRGNNPSKRRLAVFGTYIGFGIS